MADIQLTAQQRGAVEDRGGSLLVSAAAGSGKTKVLFRSNCCQQHSAVQVRNYNCLPQNYPTVQAVFEFPALLQALRQERVCRSLCKTYL